MEPGDQLPYLPRQQFAASADLRGVGWKVGLAATGSSAMRTVAGQGAIPPDQSTDRFVVLTLSGEYGLPWEGTLYAGLQNLLDRKYVVARRPAGARPGLPETLTVGYRLSW